MLSLVDTLHHQRVPPAAGRLLTMDVASACQAVQSTAVGTAIRESMLVFPLIETAHVLALGLSVGTVLWFDLRLLGLSMREVSVTHVMDQLRRWMLSGFLVMFATGLLMFWALAGTLCASPAFRIKVVFLVLAGLNILVFHLTVDRGRSQWDTWESPPPAVRLAGLASLVLWTGVIIAGRWTAFSV